METRIDRLLCLSVCLAGFLAGFPNTTVAQAPRPREAVLLETDSQASRRLETAREQIKAGQWDEAITLLRQAADQQGDKLLAVGQGRYLTVQTCCDMLLASLPPDALKIY